eukprot:9471412-Pyramimonas_sp.AAC.1
MQREDFTFLFGATGLKGGPEDKAPPLDRGFGGASGVDSVCDFAGKFSLQEGKQQERFLDDL